MLHAEAPGRVDSLLKEGVEDDQVGLDQRDDSLDVLCSHDVLFRRVWYEGWDEDLGAQSGIVEPGNLVFRAVQSCLSVLVCIRNKGMGLTVYPDTCLSHTLTRDGVKSDLGRTARTEHFERAKVDVCLRSVSSSKRMNCG